MHILFKYCFPFIPISRMLRTPHRTDLLIEVTNLMKGNTVWVHLQQQAIFRQIFICLDLYQKKVLEFKLTVVFSSK